MARAIALGGESKYREKAAPHRFGERFVASISSSQNHVVKKAAVPILLLAALAMPQEAAAQAQTTTFTTPATSGSWVVPDNVTTITIVARGASGGNRTSSVGGGGATVSGTFTVNPGDTIYFVVGEKGANGGDFDAGGGGSTGVFINGTLVMVAGAGGGADNTDGGIADGGRATTGGTGSPAGAGCTAILGGVGGAGGPGGGLVPAGCNLGTNGGSGGGGINSAGIVGGGQAGGGGRADLNPLDGLTVAQGGVAGPVGNDISGGGARGGAGFTGGGGSQARESGGGGGYSGGAGGNPGSKPGGGGSYLIGTAAAATITAGANSTDTGHGAVTINYTLPGLITKKTLLSSDPTPATGTVVRFAIDVSVNSSNAFYDNVTLTDLIPAGLTPTANNGTVTQGTYNSTTGLWTIGRINNGQTVRLIIEGVVKADQNGNTITNTTTAAKGTQTDSSTVGDDLSESVLVTTNVDLSINKTNGTTRAYSGSNTTYTITVTNNGPDPATSAVVKDTPGAGLTCGAANPVTITGSGVPAGSFTIADLTGAGIALGTLSSGQSTTLTYSCQVN